MTEENIKKSSGGIDRSESLNLLDKKESEEFDD